MLLRFRGQNLSAISRTHSSAAELLGQWLLGSFCLCFWVIPWALSIGLCCVSRGCVAHDQHFICILTTCGFLWWYLSDAKGIFLDGRWELHLSVGRRILFRVQLGLCWFRKMAVVGSSLKSMIPLLTSVWLSLQDQAWFSFCWTDLKSNYTARSYHLDSSAMVEHLEIACHVIHCCF